MGQQLPNKPVRVGVFGTVAQADRAVNGLLAAGFPKESLAVVCSDKFKEQFFRDLPTPEPAGTHTPQTMVAGGATGAAVGGLALTATAVATGGVSLLAAGTVLIGGGAILGTFAGVMMSRGFEKEIADYYDQAVQRGKILVGVEVADGENGARRAEAERILAAAGAEPIPLKEG